MVIGNFSGVKGTPTHAKNHAIAVNFSELSRTIAPAFLPEPIKNIIMEKVMAAETIDNDKFLWCVIIHLAFVVSAFAMGFLDRLNSKV